ncbi:TIGR02391 family protein [Candidatus Poriferisodalis sp.]|uniref:TIGR02391 family protein n=1 Tax=Candidatus Poriferisodalis sp. TaxID=3101277 RepID=UPI003D0EF60E
MLPLVRQVAARLDPSLLEKLAHLDAHWTFDDMSHGLEAADILIGMLAYEDDVVEILGPSGPALAAIGFHPWVWDAARGYWDDGYFGDAVHAAAEAVIRKTQVKLSRRDISGKALFQQSFSLDDPTPNKPRLRLNFVERQDEESWKSAHEGATSLGEACSQGFRNLVAHKKADLTEQQALEQLGALSTPARWVDDSELVEAGST